MVKLFHKVKQRAKIRIIMKLLTNWTLEELVNLKKNWFNTIREKLGHLCSLII